MDEESLFPIELPQTDEPKMEKPRENCLQEMIIEAMNERGIRDAELVRETGVAFSTWHGWISGEVRAPLIDGNLKKVHRYFGTIPLEYLCYGIGKEKYSYDFSKAKGWDGFQEMIKRVNRKRIK